MTKMVIVKQKTDQYGHCVHGTQFLLREPDFATRKFVLDLFLTGAACGILEI